MATCIDTKNINNIIGITANKKYATNVVIFSVIFFHFLNESKKKKKRKFKNGG